jgi:aldehyde:ferredoxin oxidoreductase
MDKPYGWTGAILHIDLTSRKITTLPTSRYSDRFIGGLGIAEKIYWDSSSPDTQAFAPDNPLIMMTGPLCGTIAPSAPRMVVCGKSPATYPERFVSASVAGFFPAELKRAGYDGIVFTGTAGSPVYLRIADGAAEIRDAKQLWGLTNSKTCKALESELGGKPVIMSIGPGAEHGSRIGNIQIDRAGNVSMGFGSVMGSKNLKAIAVSGSKTISVAHPEQIKGINSQIKKMIGQGYHNLYSKPITMPGTEVVKKIHCYACPQGCWRTLQRSSSGIEGIRKCQTAMYYTKWDSKLHQGVTEASFQATELANDYSLCILELLFIMMWLEQCIERGIVAEQQTGLPLAKMGSLEFIEALIKQIAYREGFGNILADGVLRASAALGKESRALTENYFTQTGRPMAYGPKTFIISAPVYAIEQRPTVTELHEICSPLTKWALWLKTKGEECYVSTEVVRSIAERFWGGRNVVDFSTYDGKARAAYIIQNRQHAKEALILCDFAFPIMDDASTEDHVGDPTLENRLLSAVIGTEISEQELYRTGERIFNLNRAIQLREGRRGREDDRLLEYCFVERVEPPSDIFDMYNPERFLPGKGDELISHKSTAVDREKFTRMMDEYYTLRGWDVKTGLLKADALRQLDLADIVEPLQKKGCLA